MKSILFVSVRSLPAALILFGFAACGGTRGSKDPDPLALIAEGKYKEAREVVQKRGAVHPRERAIIALCLVAENPGYQPIEISEDTDFFIWGVVTYIIKAV